MQPKTSLLYKPPLHAFPPEWRSKIGFQPTANEEDSFQTCVLRFLQEKTEQKSKVGQQFNTAHIVYRDPQLPKLEIYSGKTFSCAASSWFWNVWQVASLLQTSSSSSMSSQLPLLASSSPPSTSSSSDGVPEPEAERSSPSGNSAIGRPPGTQGVNHSTGVNICTCLLDSLLQTFCHSRMTNNG